MQAKELGLSPPPGAFHLQEDYHPLMNTNLSRRSLLASTAGLVAAGSLGTSMTNAEDAKPEAKPIADANWKIEKGRINQSVVSW